MTTEPERVANDYHPTPTPTSPAPGTIWRGDFWRGAGERAIKTFVQTFVAVVIAGVGADAVGATAGLLDVSWLSALSVAALAAILSLGTSVGNADFTAGR